jgi:hypothetical protein
VYVFPIVVAPTVSFRGIAIIPSIRRAALTIVGLQIVVREVVVKYNVVRRNVEPDACFAVPSNSVPASNIVI